MLMMNDLTGKPSQELLNLFKDYSKEQLLDFLVANDNTYGSDFKEFTKDELLMFTIYEIIQNEKFYRMGQKMRNLVMMKGVE